ncbi:MAG TPA: 16S rRNA pseudouridine(516) synthase RsuA [Pseudomonadales bacterium]|nr:16S rRNA pseudouridine(516) synthase RsuA [Pseudomonadales bacterium]
MRLDKFICHSTAATRQQVQRMVRDGVVFVNGIAVKKPDCKLKETDVVQLEGETIFLPLPRYFMLHKPAGYICANRDGQHPVVLDLLHEKGIEQLQIAGRLDIDTTGLVLITDDGAWNHKVTSPSRLCSKTYCVTLSEPLTEIAAEQLRSGVQLSGEKKSTLPAELSYIDEQQRCVRLSIHEGKYHQVKRMFAAVGNHVVTLHRESIGSIVLDTALEPGQYRALTPVEIASIH